MLLIDDPSQPITKELYPAVAKSLSAVATTIQVERLMRSAIELAWNNRDVTVWNRYFPEEITHQRPSNRTFLTRIAESIVEGS